MQLLLILKLFTALHHQSSTSMILPPSTMISITKLISLLTQKMFQEIHKNSTTIEIQPLSLLNLIQDPFQVEIKLKLMEKDSYLSMHEVSLLDLEQSKLSLLKIKILILLLKHLPPKFQDK